ncbi:hypothetical protein A8926_7155 [Saccharopolyspora spinosa]|uniref:Uncharacterized protein n=1 Tax=Saccharopolyspora spinosa TaxID=60894 RepID=A0A2N3Y801_SACSN|nr:hypothetical protein A8926_7155 [Saccharopolyspora spinosa]
MIPAMFAAVFWMPPSRRAPGIIRQGGHPGRTQQFPRSRFELPLPGAAVAGRPGRARKDMLAEQFYRLSGHRRLLSVWEQCQPAFEADRQLAAESAWRRSSRSRRIAVIACSPSAAWIAMIGTYSSSGSSSRAHEAPSGKLTACTSGHE